MELTLLKVTAALYLLAAAAFVFYVLLKDVASRVPALMLLAGFIAHTTSLAAHFFHEGYPAVAAFRDALSFKSWLMVAGYLLVQLKYRVTVLGCIVAPLAFLMALAAVAAGSAGGELPPALKTYWLPVHVTSAFVGNAVLALACAVSGIYLLQEHHLKHKKITTFMKRFPSLEALDRLNYILIVWGFPFMTVGILTGSLWAAVQWGQYWSWDPRQISSGVAWLFYGVLLQGRITAGLRGRKAALLTMAGFAVVIGYFFLGDTIFPSRHAGKFE
jgi:cytochrome c-type biogenesis protein CcsB